MMKETNNRRIFLRQKKYKSDLYEWVDATEEIEFVNISPDNKLIIRYRNNNCEYIFNKENYKLMNNMSVLEEDMLNYKDLYRNEDIQIIYRNNNDFFILNKKTGIRNISEAYKISNKLGRMYKYYSFISEKFMEKSDTAVENGCDNTIEDNMLRQQYTRLEEKWFSKESLLNKVLCKKIEKNNEILAYFPCSHNLSQMEAVEKALCNNISIIQGPPGTGKTQTILNIVLNLVMNNKTVAVVSNNNTATKNIYDKLVEVGYDFLCAPLGKKDNKKSFFSKETQLPKIIPTKIEGDYEKLLNIEKEMYRKEIHLVELQKYKEEYQFELNRCNHNELLDVTSIRENITSNQILRLSILLEKKRRIHLISKIILHRKYGFTYLLLSNHSSEIAYSLRYLYVKKKLQEIDSEMQKNKEEIDKYKETNVTKRIENISKYKLDSVLYNRFKDKKYPIFTVDNYKSERNLFFERFPIVLSSTYCLDSSIPEEFDYIIIDEASQSMIYTVLPCLAKGKNLVVLGDDKQLPPVINDIIVDQEKKAFELYNIDGICRDDGKSFLCFIQEYIDKVSKSLLKEHYRCSRQIISFSNSKVYNNDLIIMKKDDENCHLKLIETVPGNHARSINILEKEDGESADLLHKSLMNDREAMEILEIEEVKDALGLDNEEYKNKYDNKTIGIVTPYKAQVLHIEKLLKKNLEKAKRIEIGTIHTYQGKEKNIIIMSSVVNNADDYMKNDNIIKKAFINDERMINVAVTRAKDKFILVTSNKIASSNTGVLSDLIKHIKYQQNSEVVKGKVSSIFDILYSDYNEMRKKLLKGKMIESEESMSNTLDEILSDKKYCSLGYSMHVNLKEATCFDEDKFTEKEKKYLNNKNTHLDFVIYNKYDKKPLLAIEVDGFRFHWQNRIQRGRDKMKDKCLLISKLELLRFVTNESNEKQRIVEKLSEVLGHK